MIPKPDDGDDQNKGKRLQEVAMFGHWTTACQKQYQCIALKLIAFRTFGETLKLENYGLS